MLNFERCYSENAQPLLRFLTLRVGNRELAEDIVADTFERVLRHRRRFDPRRASEKTWIYGIALNLVRDHLRREASAVRALERINDDGDAGGGDTISRVLANDEIGRALRVLSDEEREVVALRYAGDLTVPEIARVIGERVSTVEGRLYRSLRKLRAQLDAETVGGDSSGPGDLRTRVPPVE
ncbi:MAG TPA: RNA polymerase sigma factor [Solirubrobacteraceae bacterium]|nr:RNA polymerase sigma factor [Solirubrobacteraceae bacterium]